MISAPIGQVMAYVFVVFAGAPVGIAHSSDQPARACVSFFEAGLPVGHRMSMQNMELFQIPGKLTVHVQGDVSYSLSQDRMIGMAATVWGGGCKYTLTGLSSSAFGGQPVFSATGFLLPRSDDPQDDETNYYVTGPMPGSVEVEGTGYYPIGSPHFSVDQLSPGALKLSYSGQFEEFGTPKDPRRIQYHAVLEAVSGQ